MSQIGREFRIEFKSAVNEFTVRCSIYESDYLIPDGDIPEVINLKRGANPLVLKTVNNDSNKFNPIFAKQAVISFITENYDINTFFDGPDNKWLVVITIIDTSVELFRGYLVLNDISQPFLPNPQTITLTATDKLGSLKDVPGRNTINLGESQIRGKVLFGIWFAHALRATGLNLDIKAMYNIRESEFSAYHLFDKIYIDALTFEEDVDIMEDFYTVLEKLLGMTALLTQYKGEWFIRRIDEFDHNTLDYVAQFDDEGNYQSIGTGTTYIQNIGALSMMKWANANQQISSDRPHKFTKIKFDYEQPKEVPCNADMERGDYISDIDATTKKYELNCWTLFEDRPNVPSTTSDKWIERKFNSFDVEVEKYAVIDVASALLEQNLISEFIPCLQSDKFEFSFEVKHNGQIETSGSNYEVPYAQIRLYANDGTYYTLEGGSEFTGAVPEWVACTSDFDTFQRFFKILFNGEDDDTKFRTGGFRNGECPAVPKDGQLQIVFTHQYKVDEFQVHIGSVNFVFYPYINGTYKKYTGHHNKIERTETGYLASLEETVFLNDTPHPILKGGLFKYDINLDQYILGEQYYDHSKNPLGTPSTLYTFGKLQSYNVWNQYNRGMRVLEGDVIGLDSTNPPDVIHLYVLTNTNPNLLPRRYMCVSFEQNWKTEIWRGVFIEVESAAFPKDYSTNHEFKYLI